MRQNRLKEIMENIKKYSVNSETITHILQGTTWKLILSYFPKDTVVIPIGLYTDGMQFNNPLKPHQDSTDMFYYFFPCLNDLFIEITSICHRS